MLAQQWADERTQSKGALLAGLCRHRFTSTATAHSSLHPWRPAHRTTADARGACFDAALRGELRKAAAFYAEQEELLAAAVGRLSHASSPQVPVCRTAAAGRLRLQGLSGPPLAHCTPCTCL